MTAQFTIDQPDGWTSHPYRAEWRRVMADAALEHGEEVVVEALAYQCGEWRWAVELQTPTMDSTIAVGAAPTLALACQRATLAADDILNAMRALVGAGEGEG